MSHISGALSAAALTIAIVLAFIMIKRRRENRLTPLAGLAFGLILAGIFFGEDSGLGYGLMGTGVVLVVVDVVKRARMG